MVKFLPFIFHSVIFLISSKHKLKFNHRLQTLSLAKFMNASEATSRKEVTGPHMVRTLV